jgi:hypothetical protein
MCLWQYRLPDLLATVFYMGSLFVSLSHHVAICRNNFQSACMPSVTKDWLTKDMWVHCLCSKERRSRWFDMRLLYTSDVYTVMKYKKRKYVISIIQGVAEYIRRIKFVKWVIYFQLIYETQIFEACRKACHVVTTF